MKKILFMLVAATLVPLVVIIALLVKFNCANNLVPDGSTGVTINVCNWGEFIADGSDGLMNVNEEFTKQTGIKVNYTTFQSNEDLYAKLKNKAIQYDVIIPSDYMVARLIKNKLIRKLDFKKIPNADLIDKNLRIADYDPTGEYSIVYAWGVIALIYDKTLIKEDSNNINWDLLWNKKYEGKILMFNNPRDAFAIAQLKNDKDLNSENRQDWLEVSLDLKKQKDVLQGYVMDQIFDKMSSGEAKFAPYYLGDALAIREINSNLGVAIPKSGTNKFIDAMCVPANASYPDEAMKYINFLCNSEVSRENSQKIKYFSPIEGVNNIGEIKDVANLEKIMLPGFSKGFTDLNKNINKLLNRLWVDIKVDERVNFFELFVVILSLLFLVILLILRKRKNMQLKSNE